MIIYFTKNRKNQKIIILHFGIGLIGTSIKKKLLKGEYFDEVKYNKHQVSWVNTQKAKNQIDLLFIGIKKEFVGVDKVYVIWSAGKAGFNFSMETYKQQLANFKKLVNQLIQNLQVIGVPNTFYLMSSAGGLFEGETLINSESIPNPKRPYGQLKLAEEQFILSHPAVFEKNIFRLSSVYSFNILNKRKGLFLVLMENGLKNKVSTIIGHESTLRDYVLDEDIARYLVSRIYYDINPGEISFIVSGKPSTIFEIRKHIEKILKKRIYLNFSSVKTNAANMSFVQPIIADNFKSSDYKTNISRLYLQLTS